MPAALMPRLRLYLDLIRWDRPAGWALLLWPTLAALWLAAGGFPGWHLLAVFTCGTILMRSAGCCINDVADRDFDRHVKRTAQRPVTSNRIGAGEALGVGAVLAFISFLLVLTTSRVAIICSIPALLISIAYPYTKRIMAMPQAILGIAFSWGIPMAFAAAQGRIPAQALWLILANLFWVLAYDTEYAMVDRDDDLKIGIRTSAITFGRWDIAAIAICYLLYAAIWWHVLWQEVVPRHPPQTALFARSVWLAGLLAVLAQAAWHLWLIRKRDRAGCFAAFSRNHWIGFTAFITSAALTQWGNR
jgi:4-hydroxybenzoate polyprenyltransferase